MENLNTMNSMGTFPNALERGNKYLSEAISRVIINAKIGTKSVIKDKNTLQRSFSVSEISSCLRQAFYRRTDTPADLNAAWTKFKNENRQKSAIEIHNVMSNCLGWSELPLSKTFTYSNPSLSLYLNGRIDSYDWENNVVYDIKTTKAVKWQAERNYIPRKQELIQIQCYESMLPKSMASKFMLLYVQEEVLRLLEQSLVTPNIELSILRIMHLIEVPYENRNPWIKTRLLELYDSTYITKTGPKPEPSSYCNFCPYKKRCTSETGISIPTTE